MANLPPEKLHLFYRDDRGRSVQARWGEILRVADLRPTDRVLDVGCAEGLITLEAAGVVEHVHGIEIERGRVAEARRVADERGIRNATFELASVIDYPFEPLSYDVSLFLAVWRKTRGEGEAKRWVEARELGAILDATRRQMVMRVSVQERPKQEPELERILAVCEKHDFDALCFSRPLPPRMKPWKRERGAAVTANPGGNLIIANRRGVDVRVGELPVLALIPTSHLGEHPVVNASLSGRP